ncbi:unnamed protein product [Phaeothamnion confervicola]
MAMAFGHLDMCFRATILGQKPLTETAVNDPHPISIQPALAAATKEMGTDVDTLLNQAVEDYETNPQASADPNLAAGKVAASVFQPIPAETAQFQSKFAALGLAPDASDALISGLVMNAVSRSRPSALDSTSLLAR